MLGHRFEVDLLVADTPAPRRHRPLEPQRQVGHVRSAGPSGLDRLRHLHPRPGPHHPTRPDRRLAGSPPPLPQPIRVQEPRPNAARPKPKNSHRRTLTAPAIDDATQLTEADLSAIIDELGDLTDALCQAYPAHKLDVYRSLSLTFEPQAQTVRAEIDLAAHRWIRSVS